MIGRRTPDWLLITALGGRLLLPVKQRQNCAGVVQISPSAMWPGSTKPGFAQGEPGIFYPTGQRLNSLAVKVHPI
jgi:hypothetical protein